MKKLKAAIMGGSFDPVHEGHLSLAEDAHEQFGIDRVVFMPCFQSPFKGPTFALAAQRFEMLRLAVEEKSWDWAEVSNYEISRPGPSYSWETAAHLREEHPEMEWSWILGTDQWEQIEKWAEPGELRDHLSFIVVTRNSTLVQERPRWNYQAMGFSHPASSTAIREDFAKNSEWLSPKVRDYCIEHELYVHGHP